MSAATLVQRGVGIATRPADLPAGLFDVAFSLHQTGKAALHWPFDSLRAQYAAAVRTGLVRKSMLASRDFENAVHALERFTLGPLARNV